MKGFLPAVLLLLAASSPALPCSCSELPSPAKARRQADAIFVARVLATTPLSDDPRWEAAYAELRIERAWEGVSESEIRLTVFLPDPEACGYKLTPESRYLIYASYGPANVASSFGNPAHSDMLSVSVCGGTEPIETAEAKLKKLKKPQWVRGDSSTDEPATGPPNPYQAPGCQGLDLPSEGGGAPRCSSVLRSSSRMSR